MIIRNVLLVWKILGRVSDIMSEYKERLDSVRQQVYREVAGD